MHLMETVATEEQNRRWLAPLASGEIRSCFCMTEPSPVAGSDPDLLLTTAKRDGDNYVIDGRKWLITGADGAGFAIVMARVEGEHGGPTMFLTDMEAPGIRIARIIDTIDSSFAGGHAEVVFEQCRIPAAQILGELGQGLRYAQVRLAPARLTHCMRWLGAARRAHDIAVERSVDRELFGLRLADHGMAQQLIADNEIDIAAARALLWQTSWLLAQGDRGTEASSRAK